MRKAYGDTSVPVNRSQELIKKMLLTHGGTAVAFVSQPPTEGFEAMMPIGDATYRIRIQAIVSEDVRDRDQEERRIWRVLYHHLKSVFDTSESGVMEFREMMLPYIVTKSNKTVAQHILPDLAKNIESRPERLLPQ